MLYTVIQIILAILLLIIMAILSYSLFNKDVHTILNKLRNPKQIKKKELILDGTFTFDDNFAEFDTKDKYKNNYKEISPSINQNSGIEYAYNFWIFLSKHESGADENKTVPLFIKGSKTPISYTTTWKCNDINHTATPYIGDVSDTGKGFLVKNPLARVNLKKGKIDAIVFEFNSISFPDIIHEDPETKNCSAESRTERDKNLFGIYDLTTRADLYDNSADNIKGKWSMITLVVNETDNEKNILFRNKAKVKLYLNGYEYLEKSGDIYDSTTAFRHNISNLHINPLKYKGTDSTDPNIIIADLAYFNYSLSDNEIVTLYNSGFNNNQAMIPSELDTSVGMNEKAGLDIGKNALIKQY
tara:strand:- start:8431 stop:9501 length:1071 start_codon:yes stop_codon:yes gene_type:complete